MLYSTMRPSVVRIGGFVKDTVWLVVAGSTLGVAALLGVLAYQRSVDRAEPARGDIDVDGGSSARAKAPGGIDRDATPQKPAPSAQESSAASLSSQAAKARRMEVAEHAFKVAMAPPNLAMTMARNIFEATHAYGMHDADGRMTRMVESVGVIQWASVNLSWHSLHEMESPTTLAAIKQDEVASTGLVVCDLVRVTSIEADRDTSPARVTNYAIAEMHREPVILIAYGDVTGVVAGGTARFCGASLASDGQGRPNLVGIFDLLTNTADPRRIVVSR